MNLLLKLKSWQLFLLLTVPSIFYNTAFWGHVFYVIWLLIYVGWLYFIGNYMNNLIPISQRPNTTYLKISCLFVIMLGIINEAIGGLSESIFQSNHYTFKNWIILLSIIYSVWSMLYIFSFAARMLESVIEGEITNLSDSLKAFFCFWFFPIGVWYIQPAVHRIIESRLNNNYIADK